MGKNSVGSVDHVAQVSQWINLTSSSIQVLEERVETLSKRLDSILFMATRSDKEENMKAVPEEPLCNLAVDIRNLDRRIRVISSNVDDLMNMLQI